MIIGRNKKQADRMQWNRSLKLAMYYNPTVKRDRSQPRKRRKDQFLDKNWRNRRHEPNKLTRSRRRRRRRWWWRIPFISYVMLENNQFIRQIKFIGLICTTVYQSYLSLVPNNRINPLTSFSHTLKFNKINFVSQLLIPDSVSPATKTKRIF
jgi:hypothetical protein